MYSIEKAVESFETYTSKNVVYRIFITNRFTPNYDRYMRYLFKNSKLTFSEETILFPFDTQDLLIIYENQRTGRLELKPFSRGFKSAIEELVNFIGQEGVVGLNKHMKELERN